MDHELHETYLASKILLNRPTSSQRDSVASDVDDGQFQRQWVYTEGKTKDMQLSKSSQMSKLLIQSAVEIHKTNFAR